MPTPKTEVRNGVTFESNEYTPEEMPHYWNKEDRYHEDAMRMEEGGCVVVECSEQQAKEISAYFVNHIFAIPTCTYYNGSKLSICCDYAGRNRGELRERTLKFISEYFSNQ